MPYYTKSFDDAIKELATDMDTGLSESEVKTRQEKFGMNSLPKKKKTPQIIKFLTQFTDILVLVLIFAAAISLLLHETVDGLVILGIVFINALLGYIQEARAEKAIEALKKMSTTHTKVLRNGEVKSTETEEIVPGDILILDSGDKVPADARLIESISLEISESVLTGESKPVKKQAHEELGKNVLLAERNNMLYRDTTVLFGRARAVVTATGINTEIGKISQMLQTGTKDESPLAVELDKVGKKLSLAAGIIIVVIAAMTLFTGHFTVKESFFTAISLAVAAIPEGLTAIVTIVLAIGVSRLAKSKAIIKRLKAVETLGSTNLIITDKTGTLTLNQMTVTNIYTPKKKYTLHPSEKTIKSGGDIINDPTIEEDLFWTLKIAILCNDAQKNSKGFVGDPTETALLDAAQKVEIDIQQMLNTYIRLHEIPFSSINKKMLVVVENPNDPDKVFVLAKGAPEVIEWMVKSNNESVNEMNAELAQQGLRILAFSYKELSKDELDKALEMPNPEDILSTYHTFAGIIAQEDPIRPEVKEALINAKLAGVETLVLTGDNKLTATNVALQLGLISNESEVMDGNELGNTKGNQLLKILETVTVFARVTPEQKLRITEAMKDTGKVVAVTGDGVNDAPAIKAADIGISMGITGTDVTKEVADMILQDDNYATIVKAIEQGRIVYDNLIKFITYLISCNISEILIISICLLIRLPLPLLPIQILWVNLVTDGLPALALGMEPGEKDIMQRKPRNTQEHLLTKKRWCEILIESTFITISVFGVYLVALRAPMEMARTAALFSLVVAQLVQSLNNRSEVHSIFSKELQSNKKLYLTIFISFLINILIIYTSVGNKILKTVPLSPVLLLFGLIIGLIPLIGVELLKKLGTRKKLAINNNI